jgi:hypothetical protein
MMSLLPFTMIFLVMLSVAMRFQTAILLMVSWT